MRALTVRQPWAWAIIHGGKDVENRTRNLGPYRGPIAIHAGLADAPASWDVGIVTEQWRWWWALQPFPAGHQRGAVIGVVDLVDVHRSTGAACSIGTGPTVAGRYGAGLPGSLTCGSHWAEPGAMYLVLTNPRPLARPIPWRGALGLWTVPADLEAAIREQVTL